MAQTGYTPIITYHSTTASAVPSASNLAPGELAVNIADMALYAENDSAAVTLIMNNPAGLTYPTADGSAGEAILANGDGTLSFGSAGISTGKAIAMAIVFG